jgi:hypothetical protein
MIDMVHKLKINQESLTVEKAKALQHGDILNPVGYQNADGTPQRFRVIGKVKTWKTMPNRVEIPLKRGMYEFTHITETDLPQWRKQKGY